MKLGKKTEEKKELEEKTGTVAPPPLQRGERPPVLRNYITIERVENGWTIEELHSRRSAVARSWPEALAHATAFAGETQTLLASFTITVEQAG